MKPRKARGAEKQRGPKATDLPEAADECIKSRFAGRGLSARTITAIVNAGFEYPEQLLATDEEELRRVPRLGPDGVDELIAYRNKYGMPELVDAAASGAERKTRAKKRRKPKATKTELQPVEPPAASGEETEKQPVKHRGILAEIRPRYLPSAAFARYSGQSTTTVWRQIRAGRLKTVKAGNRHLVDLEAFEKSGA
jgi:hypothetical protein